MTKYPSQENYTVMRVRKEDKDIFKDIAVYKKMSMIQLFNSTVNNLTNNLITKK